MKNYIQFLDIILNNLYDSIVVTDNQGIITYTNESALKLFKYNKKELIGKSVQILYPEVNVTRLEKDLEDIKKGQDFIGEWEGRRKDGKLIIVETKATLLKDKRKKPVGIIGIFRDITEKKEIFKKLKQQEIEYKSLFEQSPLSIQVFSLDGETIRVNKEWSKLWGTTMEKLKSYNVLKDPQLKKSPIFPLIKKAFKGEPVQLPPFKYVPEKTKKNITKVKYRWIKSYMYPVKDDSGMAKEVVLIHQDITTTYDREEEVSRLAIIVESAEDAILSTDLKGLVTSWNKGAERLYGFSSTEVMGKKLADLIVPKDHLPEIKGFFNKIKRGESIKRFESIRRTKDGKLINISLTVSPIRDQSGKITGASIIARDITERKMNETSQRFLADAGRILTSTLNYEKTLVSIAHSIVPSLADWSTVYIVKPDQSLERLVVAHKDPKKIKKLQEMTKLYPEDPNSTGGVYQSIRTKKSILYPKITFEMIKAAAKDQTHLNHLLELGMVSVMIVPIIIRNSAQGVIVFVSSQKGKYFNQNSLELAEELSRRSAIAIENSQLFKAAQEEIAQRKKLERTISKERQRLDELVGNVPGVVWEAYGKPDEAAQRINFVSNHVEKMLGYSVDEWLSKPNFWLQIVHPDDQFRAAQESAKFYESGTGGVSRFRWVRIDGKPVWVEAQSYVIKDENGRAIGMRGVTMDISGRMELEKRKDEFISIASHELKTPITTIKGFTQILLQFFSENERAVHYLYRMNEQVDRLTGLVNDLLDVSRIQTGKLVLNKEDFDLTKLVNDTIDDLQHTTKNHQLVLKSEGSVIVHADKYRISQLLINLISNAIKFSPKADKVIVKVKNNSRDVRVYVQDYGIGISKKNISKIFDPFYQADSSIRQSFGGLGLGLHISSEIISRHGGKVWVRSEKGKGSKFYFNLPITTPTNNLVTSLLK